jgi:protein tyrosine phosphatase (PTP) superfamily phosphohydrolase (DUF442 family)
MTCSTTLRNWKTSFLIASVFVAAPLLAQQPAGVPNFRQVNDHVFRGGQPTIEGFHSLAKMGVKTVIDLREEGDRAAEKRAVESLGMRYVAVPLRGMSAPPNDAVAKVLALFEDKSAGPVFIHCRRGADRTGTLVACYRVSHDKWENGKALAEAKSCGMSWIERAMQHYVLKYKAPAVEASAAATAGADSQ